MAYIVGANERIIHLKQSHLFGRLSSAVDTYLADSAVSRLHFLLEYTAPHWYLVDFSRNGTWLNGDKITKGTPILLTQGDLIAMGERHAVHFLFDDYSAPVDMLCCRNGPEAPIIAALELQAVNYLPNQQNCQLSIRRVDNDWLLEQGQQQRILYDGDWLTIEEQKWQIVLNNVPNGTIELHDNPPSLSELQLMLFTSLDEETTSARLTNHQGVIDLQVRSHHYLLLLLARQSISDMQQQLDSTECGWVYMEALITMLGMPETLINIQIHRARKQLETALDGLFDAKQLIERRSGQVRLSFKKIAIHKGDNLEVKSDLAILPN